MKNILLFGFHITLYQIILKDITEKQSEFNSNNDKLNDF